MGFHLLAHLILIRIWNLLWYRRKSNSRIIPVLCDELNNSPNSINEKEINRGKAQLKASLMMGRVHLDVVKVLQDNYWF